jgi:hypothetical protein
MNQNSKKQRTAITAKKTAKQARNNSARISFGSQARAQRSVAQETTKQNRFLRKIMMDSYTDQEE